jgi:RHS repeat-associated protein
MVTEPNGRVTTYTYDLAGNRSTQTVNGEGVNSVISYTYDSRNRLLQIVETRNGEITTTADGEVIENTYNYKGMRTSKTVDGITTEFYYGGRILIAEDTDDGAIRIINGVNLIARQGQDTLYYLYNGHADVVAIVNGEGVITNQYDYDVFGNVILSSEGYSNTSKYAGYYYDEETGYYYLQSRYYDPEIARFITEDTYRGKYSDPLSLNRYTYAHNNPVSYNDPNGHWLHIVVGALIGAVVNTAITAVSDYMDDGQFNSGWKEYAASAAEGAITGAVGAATGGASLLCTATASAAGVIDAGLGVVADIGATKFINSSAGKKIVSKVDDIGNAAKGKIDDFTKQAKTILTDKGGYIKLPFGQVDDVIVDQADDIGLMLYNQGMDNPISRKQALSEIKSDLGINKSQNPLEQKMVPLLDENKKRILNANNSFVETRELTYSVQGKFDVQGNPIDKVVIQDHSYGHYYDSGIGNQPSHFNVRPPTNTKNGAVQGMNDHYYFNYRNRK